MEEDTGSRKRQYAIAGIAVAAALFILGLLFYRQRRRREAERARLVREPLAARVPVQGLSEAEAAARRLEGQDNAIEFNPPRSEKEIWRTNTFNIFNLSLLGLTLGMAIFGKPLDTLAAAGTMLFGIAVNVFQELRAKKQLEQLAQSTRLETTVIREGKVRSIDPSAVVVGDALAVGPGDQILADGKVIGDGEMVVDESMLSDGRRRRTRRPGDMVYAGSYCVSGRAIYEAQKVGMDRLVVAIIERTRHAKIKLTPLQQLVTRILQTLLVIVAILLAILLLSFFRLDGGVVTPFYKDMIGLVFGIAPSGLFFMVVVAYAVGTADMGKVGALVHHASSVEGLAHVDALCIGKTGTLTETQIELDDLEPPAGHEKLDANRVRHILGDYARSTSGGSAIVSTIANAFPGNRRRPHEEAPFLALFGWSAVTFDDDDLRGTFVLGEPGVLQTRLLGNAESVAEPEKDEEPAPPAWKSLLNRGTRLFRRSERTTEDEAAKDDALPRQPGQPTADQPEAGSPQDENGQQAEASSAPPEEDAPRQSGFRRLLARAKGFLPGGKQPPEADTAAEETGALEQQTMLLAYRPTVYPLYDAAGQPQLPPELIPICSLRFSETIRPEARETIEAFHETGVAVRILSSDRSDTVAAVARQLGLGEGEEKPLGVVSGPDLAAMDEAQFGQAVKGATALGHLTPDQKADVVRALRAQNHYVAMVGGSVDDVPALKRANLGAVMQSGSQAALSVADIVLLEDSLKALLLVLDKGRRIVNGMMDMLRLYLTQILYLALLVAITLVLHSVFPYSPQQGSILAVVTMTIPFVGLTLWASTRVLPKAGMDPLLRHFALPAAAITGATGLVIHHIFLATTQDPTYAQLATTYALVAAGLLLVIFVQPPTRFWVGGDELSGDPRPAWMAIGLFIIFILFAWTWPAHKFFGLSPLHSAADYLTVGAVVVVGAFILRTIWRALPPQQDLHLGSPES